MCLACSTGIPICQISGGCGIQLFDFIKFASITGGASLGIIINMLKFSNEKRK